MAFHSWPATETTYTATDSIIWDTWNVEYSNTRSTPSTGDIWVKWNDTSATSASNKIWDVWVYEQNDTWVVQRQSGYTRIRRRQPIERNSWVERPRQVEPGPTEYEKKKEAAEKKAKDLLLDLIGPEQLKVYEKTGRLFVRGNKYDYIVKKGGLVTRIDKNNITDMCVHLSNRCKYPETDNVIAMKMAIEGDEEKVLKLANHRQAKKRPKKLPAAACM